MGGRGKKNVSKRTNKGKNIESKKMPTLPELTMFEPMDNLNELHNCQLTVRRTWFPLFFWLLDTVLVNCTILYCKATDTNTKITSKNFRIELVWSLIQEVLDEDINGNKRITRSQATKKNFLSKSPPKRKRIAYVTQTYNLPVGRLLPGNHLVEWRKKRESCLYCRYLMKNNKKGNKKSKSRAISQTNFWCIKCNVPLCCSKARPNCFMDFHTKK